MSVHLNPNRHSLRVHLIAFATLMLAACTAAPASSPAVPSAAATQSAPTVAARQPAASLAPSPAPAVAASASPSSVVPPAYTGTPTHVKVGLQGRPDQAHFELAYRRGYFAQQGIDIETVMFSSGSEEAQGLATNQIQAGSGSPSAALFNTMNRNIGTVIVADWLSVGGPEDTNQSLLVRRDLMESGAVKSMSDLRGKNISDAASPGSVSDIVLQAALDRAGMQVGDINTVYLPLADILAGLTNKSLDAGILLEPTVTQAVDARIASVLYRGGELVPGSIISTLQYSSQFATDADAGTRFMIAYLRGVRDYYDAFHRGINRPEAIQLLIQWLPLKDQHVWETAGPGYQDLNGRVNLADLNAQAAFQVKAGYVQGGTPDVSRFVDSRFSDAAVKVLGVR